MTCAGHLAVMMREAADALDAKARQEFFAALHTKEQVRDLRVGRASAQWALINDFAAKIGRQAFLQDGTGDIILRSSEQYAKFEPLTRESVINGIVIMVAGITPRSVPLEALMEAVEAGLPSLATMLAGSALGEIAADGDPDISPGTSFDPAAWPKIVDLAASIRRRAFVQAETGDIILRASTYYAKPDDGAVAQSSRARTIAAMDSLIDAGYRVDGVAVAGMLPMRVVYAGEVDLAPGVAPRWEAYANMDGESGEIEQASGFDDNPVDAVKMCLADFTLAQHGGDGQ